MIDEAVGSYRVKSKVGEGSTGVVYLAEHSMMGRRAAIKVFSSSVGTESFLRGAQQAATLSHPSLVEIFDFGNHNGNAYVVMEFLDGETLAERMRRSGPMPIDDALGFARQITEALTVVHAAGVTHGHLNPDNIVLVPDPVIAGGERVKILDAGLFSTQADSASMGKAAPYMAPEHFVAHGVIEARSDLYALGCILFEMIGGRPPFIAEDELVISGGISTAEAHHRALASQHQKSPPPPLHRYQPQIDYQVESLILHLLSKRLGDRPQSAAEVSAAIDRLESGGLVVGMTDHSNPERTPVSVSFDATPSPLAEDNPSLVSKLGSGRPSNLPYLIFVLVLCVAGAVAYFVIQP